MHPRESFLARLLSGNEFSAEPEGDGTLYIHHIALRLGPLEGVLDRRLLVPIRQHMREEGVNLAKLTKPERTH